MRGDAGPGVFQGERSKSMARLGGSGLPHERPGPFCDFQRVADLPEGGRPEADEEGTSLGVAALVLVDRLGADPEADTKGYRAERERVEVRAAKTAAP